MSSESLEKAGYSKCTRCGAPSNGKSRCKGCLKKLSTKRKTPGTKERAAQHADQALRREEGRSGTTTGGHKSGHGKRQEIQRKMQSAEKKTHSKLSLDRKNNDRGYESKNTRAVPQNLNRGRHHVDTKKLRAWKKRLKKSDIDMELLYTSLLAKAEQEPTNELYSLLEALSEEGLKKYVALFDSDN